MIEMTFVGDGLWKHILVERSSMKFTSVNIDRREVATWNE